MFKINFTHGFHLKKTLLLHIHIYNVFCNPAHTLREGVNKNFNNIFSANMSVNGGGGEVNPCPQLY